MPLPYLPSPRSTSDTSKVEMVIAGPPAHSILIYATAFNHAMLAKYNSVIDKIVQVNWLGYETTGVLRAVSGLSVDITTVNEDYPDNGARALRAKIAEWASLPSSILYMNGLKSSPPQRRLDNAGPRGKKRPAGESALVVDLTTDDQDDDVDGEDFF